MNEQFRPFTVSNSKLTKPPIERLDELKAILHEEVDELDTCIKNNEVDLVAFLDLLADMTVYVFSEADRWGLPLEEGVHIVLDSQESKLVDGKPVPAALPGKFGKGPNYVPPEPKLTELINRLK